MFEKSQILTFAKNRFSLYAHYYCVSLAEFLFVKTEKNQYKTQNNNERFYSLENDYQQQSKQNELTRRARKAH